MTAVDVRAVKAALTVAFAATDLAYLVDAATVTVWRSGVIIRHRRHPGAAARIAAVVSALPGVVARRAHDGCVVMDVRGPQAADPEVRAVELLTRAVTA